MTDVQSLSSDREADKEKNKWEVMYQVSEHLYSAQTAVQNSSPDRMAVEIIASA